MSERTSTSWDLPGRGWLPGPLGPAGAVPVALPSLADRVRVPVGGVRGHAGVFARRGADRRRAEQRWAAGAEERAGAGRRLRGLLLAAEQAPDALVEAVV